MIYSISALHFCYKEWVLCIFVSGSTQTQIRIKLSGNTIIVAFFVISIRGNH